MSAAAPAATRVIGVVNVTPDSFSDGGQWLDPELAIAHGRHMLAQGAAILDVGGESTRPGAGRVPEDVELDRVLPVVRELAGEGAAVSVDTMRAAVAARVLDAGAHYINDVSGGLADRDMPRLVAERGCEVIVSHWRGHADVMNGLADYTHVVPEVAGELSARVEAFLAAGVRPDRIIVDPGLGFAKDGGANWELLAHVETFLETGYRVLIGASRKRFLGELLERDGVLALPTYRDRATAAVSALMAERGVWAVRVHDVAGSVDAVRVGSAVRAARRDSLGSSRSEREMT
ncbi:dihydropteroate synthase [Pseudactinotalea sp.]|uniref:dihydropteroate synthase n=1 Tax=Pseudactinotalea sp. TaxID=1926260 RepID=UPI003B3A14E5